METINNIITTPNTFTIITPNNIIKIIGKVNFGRRNIYNLIGKKLQNISQLHNTHYNEHYNCPYIIEIVSTNTIIHLLLQDCIPTVVNLEKIITLWYISSSKFRIDTWYQSITIKSNSIQYFYFINNQIITRNQEIAQLLHNNYCTTPVHILYASAHQYNSLCKIITQNGTLWLYLNNPVKLLWKDYCYKSNSYAYFVIPHYNTIFK